MCNMYKPTPQKGLWFIGGGFAQSRVWSHYVALQIKAREAGIVEDTPVERPVLDTLTGPPRPYCEPTLPPMTRDSGQARMPFERDKAMGSSLNESHDDRTNAIPHWNPELKAQPVELVQAILARRGGTLLNLDRALLWSEPLARGWNAYIGAVRTQLGASRKLRELAICTVALTTVHVTNTTTMRRIT